MDREVQLRLGCVLVGWTRSLFGLAAGFFGSLHELHKEDVQDTLLHWICQDESNSIFRNRALFEMLVAERTVGSRQLQEFLSLFWGCEFTRITFDRSNKMSIGLFLENLHYHLMVVVFQ